MLFLLFFCYSVEAVLGTKENPIPVVPYPQVRQIQFQWNRENNKIRNSKKTLPQLYHLFVVLLFSNLEQLVLFVCSGSEAVVGCEKVPSQKRMGHQTHQRVPLRGQGHQQLPRTLLQIPVYPTQTTSTGSRFNIGSGSTIFTNSTQLKVGQAFEL